MTDRRRIERKQATLRRLLMGGSVPNVGVDPPPANQAPTVANLIPTQTFVIGDVVSYQFPANTFSDDGGLGNLTYSASNRPTGISFDSSTRTFSGTLGGSAGAYTVTVTALDSGGLSTPTTFTFNANAPRPSTAPSITLGTPTQTGVPVTLGTVTGASTYAYRAYLQGTPSGTFTTTSSPFTITGQSASTGYTVEARADNATGIGTVTSTADYTTAAPNPVFSTQPSISGTAQATKVLTGSVGAASNTASYSRRWLWSATSTGTYAAISGATGSTYTQVSGDIGRYIKLESSALGTNGNTAVALSAAVGPVLPSQVTYALNTTTVPTGVTCTRSSSAGYHVSGGYAIAASDTLRMETIGSDTYALIEAAESNTIAYTEEIQRGDYQKLSTTVTANYANAPTGAATADRLIASVAEAVHLVQRSPTTVVGQPYVFSIFAKAGAEGILQLAGTSGRFPANAYANFDLGFGSVVDTGADVSATYIVPAGGGWYRIAVVMTANGAGTLGMRIVFTNNSSSVTNSPSFTPSGTLDVLLWGYSITLGSALNSYIPASSVAASRSADQLQVDTSSIGAGPFKVTVNKAALNSTSFADQVYTGVNPSGGLVDVSALTGAARIKSVKVEV